MDCDPDNATGGSNSASVSSSPGRPSMTSNAWDSYDTVFLNAKAGMDGVDKKKIQKVVYDMSKGSRYFNNEQRKEADVLQRVEHMKSRAASLTPTQLADHEKATDLKIAELEASRDLSRTWVHVDMDAFYAAVETLVNPSLAGKPMAVGGMSMICTANYEARKFGVRAAMPGFIARKLCPDLIFVRPDFKKYSHYSELSRKVFHEYDPNFVARSLDEAYLDITGPCMLQNKSEAEVVEELRNKVHSVTGLTCSAGVGPNRLLAKVCSDINKPNGQFVLKNDRGSVMAFVATLPIRKVSGIGKVTERLLKDVLEVNTCADLVSKRSLISALFSQISTGFFLAVGLGIGGSETPEKEDRKSLSNERTFAAISDERQLFQKLDELVELLADDMQKEDLQGKTLTLKLKETGFEVRSRAVTLPFFISTKAEIWEHASKLLKKELPLSLRLMGLRMSKFNGKDGKSQRTQDPGQRTVTSLITRFHTSGGAQLRGMSTNGLCHEPLESSKTAHDRSLKAQIQSKQLFSCGGVYDNPRAHEAWIKDKQFGSQGDLLSNSPNMKFESWIQDKHFISQGENFKNAHCKTPEPWIGDEQFCCPGDSSKNACAMDPETWTGDQQFLSRAESSTDTHEIDPEAWIHDENFFSRADLSTHDFSPDLWARRKDLFSGGASNNNGHDVAPESWIQSENFFSGLKSLLESIPKSSKETQDRRPSLNHGDSYVENKDGSKHGCEAMPGSRGIFKLQSSPRSDLPRDNQRAKHISQVTVRRTPSTDHLSSSIASKGAVRSLHADLCREGIIRAPERRDNPEVELSGPSSSSDKVLHFPLRNFGGTNFTSGLKSKANTGGNELAMRLDKEEQNWDPLHESDHDDAVPMQIWNNNEHCLLCGIQVNDCLPWARQEHEDFHFAIWLQRQSDHENVHRSTTGTVRAPRPAGSESTKRKVSGGKKENHTPQKKHSNLPLEAFFGKAK